MKRKKDLLCSRCIFGEYVRGPCILACGWKCWLNPFRPVTMGLWGQHSERKQNREEQYSKEDS